MYALKRQKESNLSFNYTKDKNGYIIWTGWTNTVIEANIMMKSKDNYTINNNGKISINPSFYYVD
jgi:hypothetical protein